MGESNPLDEDGDLGFTSGPLGQDSAEGQARPIERESLDDEQLEFIDETRELIDRWTAENPFSETYRESTSDSEANMIFLRKVHEVLREHEDAITSWGVGDGKIEPGQAVASVLPPPVVVSREQEGLIAAVDLSYTRPSPTGQKQPQHGRLLYHLYGRGDGFAVKKLAEGGIGEDTYIKPDMTPSGDELREVAHYIDMQNRFGQRMLLLG